MKKKYLGLAVANDPFYDESSRAAEAAQEVQVEDPPTAEKLEAEAQVLVDKAKDLGAFAEKIGDSSTAESLKKEAQELEKRAKELCDLAVEFKAQDLWLKSQKEETPKKKEECQELIPAVTALRAGVVGYTGARKAYAYRDENDQYQIILSANVAKFFDPEYRVVPVWVVAGRIDHILSPSEAAKYF